ncbi:MAG TPA: HlyD family secretion protein [Candidatus Paceibacterota bacterium]|nr:HlyD family secretion protein [Candidatus Paceibacterota bacterium]
MAIAHKSHTRRTWMLTGAIAGGVLLLAAGIIYWEVTSSRVAIDSASIMAPLIDLSPSQPGVLQSVAVQPGDSVPAEAVVAQIGNQLIKTKIAGTIVSVNQVIGAQINANESVVTMIDPTQLRVVGKIDEDKGLSRIQVGDKVVFTVDAFGGKQYSGVIDEVAPTSEQTQIVFNISDARQEQQFDVKARFDIAAYPELKNGMSARMWVYGQ